MRAKDVQFHDQEANNEHDPEPDIAKGDICRS